jgi:tight adherence protein B
MTIALIAASLAAVAVLSFFVGLQRMAPKRDPMEERLAEYGLSEYIRGVQHSKKEKSKANDGKRMPVLNRLLQGRGMAEKLNRALMRADVPLTAAEFALIMLMLGGGGLLLGTWRLNTVLGIVFGLVLTAAPLFYLKFRESRRRAAFIAQLPDVLTLLVGSLRAGYGLAQAIELVAREVPEPACKEFARVVRATGLGLPLQRALEIMAERIESDDLDLMVTAINVQYEMGGNLSAVLDTISDTIRQRVRVLREVSALTAQQRLTGTILALLPVGLAVAISMMQPDYFEPFFEPGWPQVLPLVAISLMVIGFLIIQKILDIKV